MKQKCVLNIRMSNRSAFLSLVERKWEKNLKTLFLLFCLSLFLPLHAQVTIGSETPPETAALLEIKEYATISENGDTTVVYGGILLPRIELKNTSTITVIPSNASQNKKADLTGLLVYNVSTSEIDEGIYEWDGKEWSQLGIFSAIDGSLTQKSIVKTSKLNESNAPVVNMGLFAFRLSPGEKPQCRLTSAVTASTKIWYHIARFWDYNEIGKVNEGDVGYTYDIKNIVFSPANYSYWQDLRSTAMVKNERYEIWLADPVNKRAYNVQFINYKEFNTPVYLILVTEY
jgi:hypothetical protein